ncbi:MAG: WYL domain-containing protein [Prevotella sp.]|nr:WYL domain-containing protein [Prevotella sp.]
MSTPALFKEYIWLVNTIYQARDITLSDINEKWIKTEMSGGVDMARSTFNRHKDAIEDIFGIYIECDRKNGYKYYIGNADVLNEDSVQNWMLSTLSVNNIISESLSLQNRILLESIPSADVRLEIIISSMKKDCKLRISYLKYGSNGAKDYFVAPYCLKLYHRRWYILCRLDSGDLRIFSLDRIKEIYSTDESFMVDPDFDAEAYFSDCFGVVREEKLNPERIVIRAFGTECNYLRDLPIHKTQREIAHTDDYTDFELYLRPTLDLQGQILSRGSRLKVLSPKSLAEKISRTLEETSALYKV